MRLDVLRYAPTFEFACQIAEDYLRVPIIAHKVDILGEPITRWYLEAFHDKDAEKVRDYNIAFQYNQYIFGKLNYAHNYKV